MAFTQSVFAVQSTVGSTIHMALSKGPPLVFRPMIFFTVKRNLCQGLSASFCAHRAGNEFKRAAGQVKSELQASQDGTAAVDVTQFKHVLLPITDRNPYLSDGTRQAAATTTALAKKYGADITVVVIDENNREVIAEHDARLSSIRWHLAQGGFEEFGLMERLGEGKKPTAVIGEVADELNLDLVVISMEAIHSKHVDANLLAEFVPCPVLLLPL